MPNPDEIYKNINQIGRIEVIKQLHELYSLTEDKKVRIRILELLNQLSDKAHFNEIESYFISDEDPYVRIEAAKLLAFNYEDKKAIKPLIWVIENEVAKDLKNTALRLLVALAQVKKEHLKVVVEILKKILKSRDDQFKMEAIESLGILEELSSIDDLINELDSNNKLIRIRAIKALEHLKSEKAIPHLLRQLSIESLDVWKTAFIALKNVCGNSTIDYLLQMLSETENSSDQESLLRGIIKVLGQLEDKNAILPLLNLLKTNNRLLKSEIIEALDKIDKNWAEYYKK